MIELRVVDLWKEYEGKPLLRGINFNVSPGETLCLLGASGSGKSTILRIIAGIERPDLGEIVWNGEVVNELPVHKRNFNLMFQDYALFPHLSVGENVAFGLRMRGIPSGDREKRVKEALDQVNMSGFERRGVTDLSGGEQQRIALARALAPRPALLMLDEPLAALDHALRVELQEELRFLLKQAAIPVLYVTHDQEEAAVVGDRLALLHQGVIVQSGATEDVYQYPVSRWVAEFLGMTNILEGEVIGLAPLKVRSACGTLQPENERQKPLSIGQMVTILVKPAGVTIQSSNNHANGFTGTVTGCSFRGAYYRLKVHLCGEQEFSFLSTNPCSLGEEVSLHLSSTSLVLLD